AIGRNWVNSFRYGLTRQGFSQQGDSDQNAISFRGVFFPVNYNRTTSRTTPVHNIVDDVAWIKGSHTIKFGTNVRLVKNNRTGFTNAYDSAQTNFFFYSPAGTAVTDPLDTYIGNPANNLLPDPTLNVRVRDSITGPVHETHGFGVVIDISTDEFLRLRIDQAFAETHYVRPLTLVFDGPNGKGYLFDWDKNKCHPRISVAW